MYLYNVAYFTMRGIHVRFGAILVWADNEQEAKGFGIEYVETLASPDEGWSGISVRVVKVDDDVIRQAYAKLDTTSHY